MKLVDKALLIGLTIINILVFAITNTTDPEVKTIIKEVPVEKVVEKIVEVPVEIPVEKIVEKVVEVPVENRSTKTTDTHDHSKEITGEYKERLNGDITIEFSDYSWVVINHETKKYIFQPACMGDWDMKFDNYENLKMAMETYFQDAKVNIEKPQDTKQSAENEILNPEKIGIIEQELNKVPAKIKQLLIDNGVEIHLQEDLGENYQEGVYTYGIYNFDTNIITMDATENSIELALIHEIGHALDDIYNLRNDSRVIESYEEKEIDFSNPHFESSVVEYVAECIQQFYNGNLAENTKIFDALNNILEK